MDGLKLVCEDPRRFNEVVNNENSRRIILAISQDKSMQDFMYNMCDEVKEAVTDAQKALSNHLSGKDEKRLSSLIQVVRNGMEIRDKPVQNLPSHERPSQELTTEVVFNKFLGLVYNFMDKQHEKDKMRAMQDSCDKERLYDIVDNLVHQGHEKDRMWMEQDHNTKEMLDKQLQRQYTLNEKDRMFSQLQWQHTEEINKKLANAIALGVIMLGGAYFIDKCKRQRSKRQEGIDHLRARMAREDEGAFRG